MSAPGQPPPPSQGPRPGLILGWSRWVHFYCSLALTGVFLFYAGTGFLANRSAWFVRDDVKPVAAAFVAPGDVTLEPGALAQWLGRRLHGNLDAGSVEASGEGAGDRTRFMQTAAADP